MSVRHAIPTVIALLLVSSSTIGIAGSVQTATPTNSDSAIPGDGPDYGVNNSTFQRLWSEDTDNGNLSADDLGDVNVASRSEYTRRLAQSTDIPFTRPPQAAGDWNRGDFDDYTPGSRHSSVHPARASLTNGVYIKDASVSIFAIQPSTILHR